MIPFTQTGEERFELSTTRSKGGGSTIELLPNKSPVIPFHHGVTLLCSCQLTSSSLTTSQLTSTTKFTMWCFSTHDDYPTVFETSEYIAIPLAVPTFRLLTLPYCLIYSRSSQMSRSSFGIPNCSCPRTRT